jgi:hypothetical protein
MLPTLTNTSIESVEEFPWCVKVCKKKIVFTANIIVLEQQFCTFGIIVPLCGMNSPKSIEGITISVVDLYERIFTIISIFLQHLPHFLPAIIIPHEHSTMASTSRKTFF